MDHVEKASMLGCTWSCSLQTVPIHEDCVVVEVIIVYTIFADELFGYPPNDEVMKLGQTQRTKVTVEKVSD
jgi:hypothetical protein